MNKFVTNEVIDMEHINEVVTARKFLSYEYLKSESDRIRLNNQSIRVVGEENNKFNYYEVHDYTFKIMLCYLSLDELIYIRDNNLFNFNEDNIMDYRCKKIIDDMIMSYSNTLDNLTKVIEKYNIGTYFLKYADFYEMAVRGCEISTILGLNRENVTLTDDGVKLKTCIDNIDNLYNTCNNLPNQNKKR